MVELVKPQRKNQREREREKENEREKINYFPRING